MPMEVNRRELKARARERIRVPPRFLESHAGLSPAALRRSRRPIWRGGPHRAPRST